MRAEYSSSASYDAVPYASYPYAQCHPRNLAALATLFSMAPAEVAHCRLLEIGCASGGNLLPMAVGLPHAQFHGIDASARQIEEGQKVIAQLRLDNVSLQHQDVLDFPDDAGEFDFIVCHGVYSWVKPAVQEKILSVCSNHLAANGVAYISYNTYPGWYLRRGVREMMTYHAAGFDDTQTSIDQSRALIDFLVGAVASNGGAYEKLLHEELQILRTSEDSYLFHEHLEAYNEPLFFHQFVDRADQAGLRFLCEASFSSMVANEYSEEVQQTLRKIAPDIIQMEQYLDFLRNRKFRQTLLCHQHNSLVRAIVPERIHRLFVSAPLTPSDPTNSASQEGDPSANELTFEHPSGRTVTVTEPIQKSALKQLASLWPREVSVEQLADLAWQDTPEYQRPSREACLQDLAALVLECFSSGISELFAHPSNAHPSNAQVLDDRSSAGQPSPDKDLAAPSETPQANPLVRYQAARGTWVTNARHESVKLGSFDRLLLQKLDGSASVATLTDQFIRQVGQQEVVLEGNSNPSEEDIRRAIRTSLTQLARAALLAP